MLPALIIAAAISLGTVPRDEVARQTVDLVELNHFYDEHGRLVFDQVIFYGWSFADRRYSVIAWRLAKTPDILPIKHHQTGCYVSRWQDGNTLREVYGRAYRETWTQYDVELAEREILPKDQRRELRAVRVK